MGSEMCIRDSLGGMAACSASGTMAVRYGTMKTTVLGLTVVMANGEIINTGTRSKKTSAGYNLTNLFVGSEGTLGIITEVHLRLSPIPESIMSAVCQFPDLDSAVLTAQEIIQYGVPIASCLLYTSPSPRDLSTSRMPSSA